MGVYNFFVKLGILRPLDELRKEQAEIREQQRLVREKRDRQIAANLDNLNHIYRINTGDDWS